MSRTMPIKTDVLIVGGGLAAQRAIETLRARGFDGAITVACAEPHRPYDRPPLSKEALHREVAHAELAFRDDGWYRDQLVDVLPGAAAERLDAASRTVALADGRSVRYERLLIATGGEPRRLPALDGLANVHVLRNLEDASALREALVPGARVAVVGAGFIGQEVAAAALARGAHVTVLEATGVPLEAIVGPALGDWFAGFHRRRGIDLRCDAMVAGARERGGRAEALELSDGSEIAADAVVVGIGMVPVTGWLEGSPLAGPAVVTDAVGRTALPGVWAAGDVAATADRPGARPTRTEHWEAAARRAAATARDMLGLPATAEPPASFWSDQHGVRIQWIGSAAGADAVQVDGRPEDDDFQALLTRDGAPVGALLVGRPHALASVRRTLARQAAAKDPQTTRRAA